MAGNLRAVGLAVICLVNQERLARGLNALAENAELDRSAVHHSRDMVAAGYFDHVSPGRETVLGRVLAAGYPPPNSRYLVGENLATAPSNAARAAQVVAAWMNSPAHRANILNAGYRETGVGVTDAVAAPYARGMSGATYTQEFGAVWPGY